MLCDGLEHVGGGGLAVGSGYAQHLHLALGIAVESRGHFGHGLSGVFYDDLGQVQRQLPLREKCHGPGLCRGFGKGMSIKELPDDAAEHAPGLDPAGIVLDGNDVHVPAHIAKSRGHGKFR